MTAESTTGTITINIDLKEAKTDLLLSIDKCSLRGLVHSVKWLAELNYSLKNIKLDSRPSHQEEKSINYPLAKAYFEEDSYDRCAHVTKPSLCLLTRFMHFFARYLSIEKKAILEMTEPTVQLGVTQHKGLCNLATDLRLEYSNDNLDGFGLYLYGVVLKKLSLPQALEVLQKAVHLEPMHWGAWMELSPLITDKNQVKTLQLPDHWIKPFFFAHVYKNLQMNDEALDIVNALQQEGFDKSAHLKCLLALIYHDKREVDKGIAIFQQLQAEDPYRLDNMDTYSNLLYVKGDRDKLAALAVTATEIDKYRVETCYIIGNYYSLRTDHHKAIVYFQRALRLNPRYVSAWTLMGHEFMEMKNVNAAIRSYRQAIEVNRRDYRAWYGLGQTYELSKMYSYSHYYYNQAQLLRPNDSRICIALGITYEKLDRDIDAIKCYLHAREVGDIEGVAIFKLARLFQRIDESQQAVVAYEEFLQNNEARMKADSSDISAIYLYLANYYITKDLEKASEYLQHCLEHEETKEQGKALLYAIDQKQLEQMKAKTKKPLATDDAGPSRVRQRLAFTQIPDDVIVGLHDIDLSLEDTENNQ